jgi:phosphoribosylamine--glycine ligase
MMKTARGELHEASIEWDERACVGVVAASGGYPDKYGTGYEITGLDEVDDDVFVFHAGTKLDDLGKNVVTSGGRVLTVSALGETIEDARLKAYANIERINFKQSCYRKDIALFS